MTLVSERLSLNIDEEAELAQRACAGCRVSFERLVESLRPRLLRFLQRWTRDQAAAEDLVQDTFTRAYQNLNRYDSRWRFTTWLFTIGRRIAIDQSRRAKSAVPSVELTGFERATAESPDGVTMLAEQREHLWRIINQKLPAAQAEALWLRYGESLNIAEIARITGKTQVGVRVTLLRARQALAPHVRKWSDASGSTDAAETGEQAA